jgi:hypothetical protein
LLSSKATTASGNTILSRKMAQANTQRESAETRETLHEDMGDLDITSPMNGSEVPNAIATENTSVAEAEDEVDTHTLALDMQRRCRLLLDELEQFQAYLKKQSKENDVELRTFKSDVQSEMKFIDKVHFKIPKH